MIVGCNILTYLHITDGYGYGRGHLVIQGSLLGILLEEVVNPAGKHHYDGSKIFSRD
jgi:hypothetical protein